MSEEKRISLEKKKEKKNVPLKKRTWVSLAILILLIPATMYAGWRFGDRSYYIVSLLIILYSMAPFFLMFERRRPQARELVVLAVLCAIAVASRAAFIALPSFKPMTAVIMISAVAFGPESGFLVGAVSGFVSNFIFGQGPWTPWQMFAFGMAGFLTGLFCTKRILSSKRIPLSIFGALLVILIVGPLLDTSTFFFTATEINAEFALSVYTAGLPMNAVHAAATFLTLILFSKPMLEKLERIKIKYGMMEADDAL